ncbi:MAG: hypothetical protein HY758_05435 [Nitrospirae bacterium]|nr:hypothetical protein [Nitrospirota bacterium]
MKIMNILPQTILKKVISTFNAEISSGEKDVLAMTLKILEELEGEKERFLIEDLVTRSMKNMMAVIGMEDILASLQEGKIRELVFLKDLKSQGFKCANCNFLTVQASKSCPYCSGKFEQVHYMVDYAAQKAVEQGALIEVITKSDELGRAGGIGAFLRF